MSIHLAKGVKRVVFLKCWELPSVLRTSSILAGSLWANSVKQYSTFLLRSGRFYVSALFNRALNASNDKVILNFHNYSQVQDPF